MVVPALWILYCSGGEFCPEQGQAPITSLFNWMVKKRILNFFPQCEKNVMLTCETYNALIPTSHFKSIRIHNTVLKLNNTVWVSLCRFCSRISQKSKVKAALSKRSSHLSWIATKQLKCGLSELRCYCEYEIHTGSIPRVVRVIETERRVVVSRHREEGRMRSHRLMCTDFHFHKVRRVVEMDGGDSRTTLSTNTLNATELDT